jgi:hypothetical protein
MRPPTDGRSRSCRSSTSTPLNARRDSRPQHHLIAELDRLAAERSATRRDRPLGTARGPARPPTAPRQRSSTRLTRCRREPSGCVQSSGNPAARTTRSAPPSLPRRSSRCVRRPPAKLAAALVFKFQRIRTQKQQVNRSQPGHNPKREPSQDIVAPNLCLRFGAGFLYCSRSGIGGRAFFAFPDQRT